MLRNRINVKWHLHVHVELNVVFESSTEDNSANILLGRATKSSEAEAKCWITQHILLLMMAASDSFTAFDFQDPAFRVTA